jgi:hypothetical protein
MYWMCPTWQRARYIVGQAHLLLQPQKCITHVSQSMLLYVCWTLSLNHRCFPPGSVRVSLLARPICCFFSHKSMTRYRPLTSTFVAFNHARRGSPLVHVGSCMCSTICPKHMPTLFTWQCARVIVGQAHLLLLQPQILPLMYHTVCYCTFAEPSCF